MSSSFLNDDSRLLDLKMSSSLLNDGSRLLDLLPPEPYNASKLILASRYSKTLLEENKTLSEEVERLKYENLELKKVTQ